MFALVSRCRVCLASGGGRLSYILFTTTPTRKSTSQAADKHDDYNCSSGNGGTQVRRLASALARHTPRPATIATDTTQAGSDGDKHTARRRLLRARQRRLTRSGTPAATVDRATREQRRDGFHALVRWCEMHAGDAVAESEARRAADRAATTWVQNMLPFLSCGQCLLLIGMLCDVVCRCAASTSVAHDAAERDDLGHRLSSLVATLVRRALESSQLESQSLPLLLSAFYGLHRVTHQGNTNCGNCNSNNTDNGSRRGLSAAAVTVLQPPAALVFAVLHHFRDDLSLRRLLENDPAHSVELLCTFLLVMDVECRQAYMAVDDYSLIRNVHSLLMQYLRDVVPPLPTQTDAPSATQPQPAHGASEADARQVRQRGTRRRAVCTMGECIALLHNVEKATMQLRLTLAQYLLCMLNDPACLSRDELALLPDALDQLHTIGRQERLPLTNYIVERAAVPADSPLRIRLACFSADPRRYLADVRLGADDVAALTQPAMRRQLCGAVGFLPWPTLRSFLLHMLAAASTAASVTQSEEGPSSSPALLPLTGDVAAVLQCLLDQLGATDDAAAVEQTAVRAMTADLVCRIDWVGAGGVEGGDTGNGAQRKNVSATDAVAEHAAHDVSKRDGSDAHAAAAATLRLYLYVRCREQQLFTVAQAQCLPDKLLLNRYVLPVLSNTSPNNLSTLVLIRSTLPLLCSDASRRQLMERVLRYNRSATVPSLYRFFEHLGQCTVELGVSSDDLVAQLLRRDTLEPKLLFYRAAAYEHNYAFYMKTYTHYLTIALACLLCNPASSAQLAQKASKARAVVMSWLNGYYKQFTLTTPPAATAAGTECVTVARHDAAQAVPDDAAEPEEGELEDGTTCASLGDGGAPHMGNGDVKSGMHDTPTTNTTTAAEVVGQTAMERLFTLLLRARCTLSPDMCRTFTSACRAALDARLAAVAPTSAASLDLSDRDAARRAEEAMAPAPEQLPPPAHFVLLTVAADESYGVPLSLTYARHLLATCDFHIFHHVVLCMLTCTRAAPWLVEAGDRHAVRAIVLEELLRRLDTAAATTVGASGHRVGVSVLFRVLRSLAVHDNAAPADTQSTIAATPAKGNLVSAAAAVEEEEEEGGKGECVEVSDSEAVVMTQTASGGDDDEDDKEEIANTMDRLLGRALAWLSNEEVQRVAVPRLGYCAQLAPHATLSFFVQRVTPLLPTMPHQQLLRLAKAYLPSAEAVAAELKRRPWPAASAQSEPDHLDDFVDFMSVARGMPWCVSASVVARHLPRLSFAWCTRLLAALLSAPHGTAVPIDLLQLVLERVDMQIDAATSAERELLLGVLQPYSGPVSAAPAVRDEVASTMVDSDDADKVRPALDEADKEMVDVGLGATVADAWPARHALISACCDKLLLVDKIRDATTLRTFLELHTSALHPSGQAAVVGQVHKVLAPLLVGAGLDVKAVMALVRLLCSRRLLFEPTAAHILHALSAALNAPQTGSSRTAARPCLPMQTEELAVYVELIVTLGKGTVPSSMRRSEDGGFYAGAMAVLRQLARCSDSPVRRVALLGALVETLDNADLKDNALRAFAHELCTNLLCECDALSASSFARFMHYLSRLNKLDLIKDDVTCRDHDDTGDAADPAESQMSSARLPCVPFAVTLRRVYEDADAHSRCVMLKAFSTDAEAFAPHIDFMMHLTQRDIAVLAPEDLELVLAATLQLRAAATAEAVLDAVGTRLLGMLDGCRRSTLVRLLQCHAHFGIRDDALLTRVLHVLDEQCSRDVRLETAQVLTMLEAAVQLQMTVPDRLLIRSFAKLEQKCIDFSAPRLAQVGQLIIDLEMGYSGGVHRLIRRIFDHREGYRSNRRFRAVVEGLCDVFDVELSAQVRALRLRQRRHDHRVAEYWQRQVQLDTTALAAAPTVCA